METATSIEPTMQMYTVHDVAKLLCLSESATYRLIKSGEIKPLRVGRAIRFTSTQINSYINSLMEN